MEKIKIIESGGITTAKGFETAGIYCGIRKKKKDIAIIKSNTPASLAAVFTQNKTIAAPVIISKKNFENSKKCTAIVVNSGNANACTGERGMIDARRMVSATAKALNIPEDE